MARFEEIKYTPLSHEYELHFSALLRDLTHELDQMLDGYGGLPDDAQSTRAVLERLRAPIAEAYAEYFGEFPVWFTPDPTPQHEPKKRSIGVPCRKR